MSPGGRNQRVSAVAAGLLAALAGCAGPAPPAEDATRPPAEGLFHPRDDTGYRYPTPAPVADSLAVRDLVARSRGRVVVLFFWTRYGERNREELARLRTLQEHYRDAGVSVIACNLDDPMEWSSFTRPLLLSVRGNFPNVVVPERSREALRTWLSPAWQYECPARFVIGRDGKLARCIIGAQEAAWGELELAVRDLLAGAEPREQVAHDSSGARLEVKLVDVARGRAVSVAPAVECSGPDVVDPIAEHVLQRLAEPTARVAVLPFVPRGDPLNPPPDGTRYAERLARCLRLAGVYDLVEPHASLEELQRRQLSPLSVEFDPTCLRGRWRVDYVVLGWWTPPAGREATAEPGSG